MELLLLLVRHERAKRVVEVRHDHDRLYVALLDGSAKLVETDTLAGTRGNLDRPEIEALDDLKETEVSGRLYGHGVPGLGDGAQAKVERLGATRRHNQLVVRERHAGLEITPRDLAGKGLVAVVEGRAHQQGGVTPGYGAED